MNLIQSSLIAALPPKRKSTPSGWISFNAPCCHNRGESHDRRQRGGLLINSSDNSFQYHCFNCNFKAGWRPGQLLTKNTRQLLSWLGLAENDIAKLNLYALKIKDQEHTQQDHIIKQIKEKPLPDNSKPIETWLEDDTHRDQLIPIIDYITDIRGMNWAWYTWYWSPQAGYHDRVIIPFYLNDTIVGYTARKINPGKPKYITDSQPGYVFNIDKQCDERQFIILVEGQFDAISVDGCAIMTNDPGKEQILRLKTLNKEIIVVPDRDSAGAKLIQAAINNDWSVSLPPWEEHCKDVADAVKLYGRLYTMITILHYKQSNKLRLELMKRTLEKHGQ